MTATNHALTGAFIGLSISNPLLAVPLAFLSHFACDALPHYDPADTSDAHVAESSFDIRLIVDAALCGSLVLILLVSRPQQWLLAIVCAFIATTPDFAWLPGYIRVKRGQTFAAGEPNQFMKFAAHIQWFARPIGAVVELAWFVGFSVLIAAYL